MDFNIDKIKEVMTVQLYKNDVVANNLANVNTVGFKRDVPFIEYLKEGAKAQLKVQADFQDGTLRNTGNQLDLALQGPGFFTVSVNDQVAYTRDGHFSIDEEGFIITNEGNKVLGEGGWINVSEDGLTPGEIIVNKTGELYINDQYVDTLRITDFDSYQRLKKIGANLFTNNSASVRPAEQFSIWQGYLEDSNVDPIKEMVNLIEIQRQYESSQRALRTLDSIQGRAVNDVGRYR